MKRNEVEQVKGTTNVANGESDKKWKEILFDQK